MYLLIEEILFRLARARRAARAGLAVLVAAIAARLARAPLKSDEDRPEPRSGRDTPIGAPLRRAMDAGRDAPLRAPQAAPPARSAPPPAHRPEPSPAPAPAAPPRRRPSLAWIDPRTWSPPWSPPELRLPEFRLPRPGRSVGDPDAPSPATRRVTGPARAQPLRAEPRAVVQTSPRAGRERLESAYPPPPPPRPETYRHTPRRGAPATAEALHHETTPRSSAGPARPGWSWEPNPLLAVWRGLGDLLIGLWRGLTWSTWRMGRALVLLGVTGALCLGLVLATATWEVSRFLPADSALLMDGRERGSVTVLDKDGVLLGVRGQRFRRLTVADAAPVLVDAILSTEDRRFYWHFGVDPVGLLRAIVVNLRADRIQQGGSSITQQVAKLAFLTNERRLTRKLRELPYALALEWNYSKDEILSIYLNRAYLGAGSFGFEAASRRYFDKSAGEVTAAEAAMLAGLLRAPSRWSPTSDFGAAQDRARVVLSAMADAGALNDDEYIAAGEEIATMSPRAVAETAPFFVDWVADQVPDRLWEQASDLVLRTTLDRAAQTAAEAAIVDVFEKMGSKKDTGAESAVVTLAPDGSVRAMVGGRDYGRSQFNRAVSARRQLGSAFKPFVYTAALEAGVSPNSEVEDAPIQIGNWSPSNYAHKYSGWLPLATALAKSSNVAAVRLSQRAGVPAVVELARRFGFTGEIPPYPSIALGVVETSPLELANAFSVFRNQGEGVQAHGVDEILSRDGHLLWKRATPPRREVISAENAEYMTAMLRQVVLAGTGRRAQLGEWPVAGKTGTTQDYRDAWFAGFTANLLTVTWMGKDDFTVLDGVTGGNMPAQIWRQTMEPLHETLNVAMLAERPVEALAAEDLEMRDGMLSRNVGGQETILQLPSRTRRITPADAERSREFRNAWRKRYRD